MLLSELPRALFFLPAPSLRDMGEYLAGLARACNARAAEIDARAEMHRRVAAELAARPDPDTPYFRKMARRRARAARDIEIMRLAGKGWRNREIAAKVRPAVTPGRISQIIQRRLRSPGTVSCA
jgi:hypothetical protein